MLYNLLGPLSEDYFVFNLIRYLTFRSGASVVTALVICFLIGPQVIAWLKSKQGEGQPIRDDGPEGHLLTKVGTPTMGGLLILIALTRARRASTMTAMRLPRDPLTRATSPGAMALVTCGARRAESAA